MFGKVVQLLGVEFEVGFNVIYGIHNATFKRMRRHNLNFAELLFSNYSSDASTTYIRSGYSVEDRGDGFKKITVFNGNLEKNDKEEILLVCIPYANYLKFNAKKVAGRYPTEAILEMRAGDTVEVSKFSDGREAFLYMAVEAGNEMFLIKKTR